MFLQYGSSELDQHSILSDFRLSSDHALLSINIPIFKEIIQTSKLSLAPKSDQESAFIEDIILNFKIMDMSNIEDMEKLERVVNQAWTKNAKKSKISKYSKQWWSEECSRSLNNYRASRSLEHWKKFKKVVKDVKRSFFDDKIQEIANKNCGPWELMN